jgi:hypothetical protein
MGEATDDGRSAMTDESFREFVVARGPDLTLLPNGFPPATARVRLFDANGVYATGTPEGAGADTPSPTPGSTGSPTAEPSSATVMASRAPSAGGR